MNKILIFIIVVIIGSILFFTYKPTADIAQNQKKLRIRDIAFTVDIADTQDLRMKGLSGRSMLGETQGMLFVNEEEIFPGIWMKDMNFSIDIIWIDKNMKIAGITERVSPETFPQVFYPPSAVMYVLEIKAGEADLIDAVPGDTVYFD